MKKMWPKKGHFSQLDSSKGPLTDIKHWVGQLSKERERFLPGEKNLHVVAAVAGSRVMFLEQFFFTGVAGISFSFFRLLYGTKSRIGPLSVMSSQQAAQVHEAAWGFKIPSWNQKWPVQHESHQNHPEHTLILLKNVDGSHSGTYSLLDAVQ